jgi:hypothetical protein
MAATWYDEAALHSDKFYKAYPSQKNFVTRHWGNFVGQARQAMIQLLGKPHISDVAKEDIADAIFSERTLPVGGKSVGSVPSLH